MARQSDLGGALRGARVSDADVREAVAAPEGAAGAVRRITPLSDVSATPAILYPTRLSRNLGRFYADVPSTCTVITSTS